MAKQWHIDNASALIVAGTRFELQTVSWRSEHGSSVLSARIWIKSTNQSGGGFKITAPLYLPDEYWGYFDNYGNYTTEWGVVFKERTWHYYGLDGYTAGGTQYPITTLSPYTKAEAHGNVLSLDGLRAFPGVNVPNLYFDKDPATILSGFLANTGVATRFQFYGLGVY